MVASRTPEHHRMTVDENLWSEQAAPPESVDYILAKPIGGEDNRSSWVFIRLPSGDLVLATYPQGETYLMTEQWRDI